MARSFADCLLGRDRYSISYGVRLVPQASETLDRLVSRISGRGAGLTVAVQLGQPGKRITRRKDLLLVSVSARSLTAARQRAQQRLSDPSITELVEYNATGDQRPVTLGAADLSTPPVRLFGHYIN